VVKIRRGAQTRDVEYRPRAHRRAEPLVRSPNVTSSSSLELQADCLAGSWASVAARRPQTFEGNNNLLYLESGDLSEGLRAAEAVGDDRIQAKAGQQVNPHNWTHGSAEQREAWFTLGLDTGDPARCNDTFDESIDATRIMPI
jgi:predicted metalloprotease